VADRGVGKARMGAVPAGFATRASGRERERERTTVARVRMVIELGGSVLKIRMVY
jgi:hypothetical protein